MAATDDQRTATSGAPEWIVTLLDWFDPDEPHPVLGPFTRWPLVTDGVLAAAVLLGSLGAVALSQLADGEEVTAASIVDLPLPGFLLLALCAATLLWRRARPLTVTTVILGAMMVWAVAGYGDGNDLALIVALYSVGRYGTRRWPSLAAVGAAVAVATIGTIIDADQRVDVLPAVLVTVLPWYVGRRLRNRGDYLALLQDRAEQLEAEQLAEARRAVADERSRIARELHDVVAHRVSMMTVQAGAAKTIAPHDPKAAIDAMADVEGAGRQALGELRHLLGVLRPDGGDPTALGPQPGLADIETLVDDLRHTGAAVTLTQAGPTGPVPAAVELSAYRIVQESLTNIVRHAGTDPVVEVVIEDHGSHLSIEIVNTVEAPLDRLPGSGFGIIGMVERASLLGGELTAGPVTTATTDPVPRFRVHALLPLEPGPA